MKFSTAILSVACLFTLVAAQSATVTTSAAPSISAIPETKEAKCLKTCGDSDVKCKATCLGVPTPSEEDVAKTQKCAADCKQGDGSAEQTKAYGDCQLACFKNNFLPGTNTFTGTESPKPTGTNTPGNTGGNTNGNSTGNGTDGGNGTDKGDNNSGAAGTSIVYGASFAGLVAAVGAVLVL
ncbi:hypothetical protein DFH27DRAFT_258714 [Peziza echinospora]|nr:hypothetical protein DFH27DRAFT_258714 [Peziza echinospora]